MSGTARSGLFLTARRGLLTSDGVIGRDNTNLDAYERVIDVDAKQSAIVVAVTICQWAMSDALLPRFNDQEMPPLSIAIRLPTPSSRLVGRSPRLAKQEGKVSNSHKEAIRATGNLLDILRLAR
jgi:hypothetical protein